MATLGNILHANGFYGPATPQTGGQMSVAPQMPTRAAPVQGTPWRGGPAQGRPQVPWSGAPGMSGPSVMVDAPVQGGPYRGGPEFPAVKGWGDPNNFQAYEPGQWDNAGGTVGGSSTMDDPYGIKNPQDQYNYGGGDQGQSSFLPAQAAMPSGGLAQLLQMMQQQGAGGLGARMPAAPQTGGGQTVAPQMPGRAAPAPQNVMNGNGFYGPASAQQSPLQGAPTGDVSQLLQQQMQQRRRILGGGQGAPVDLQRFLGRGRY
jgi:hypothetical protein